MLIPFELESVVIEHLCQYHGTVITPELPPGEALRISASGFLSYLNCPANFGARLDGKFGADSVPAFRGALAHAVFARHLEGGEIAEHDFDGVCRRAIGSSNINYKMANLGLGITAIRETIAEVGEMYQRFKRLPRDGFRSSEVHLEVDFAPGVTLLGRVDAVYDDERGVRLVDWKSGDLGEVAQQLRFYALVWYLSEGEAPGTIEAFSVQSGEQYREEPTDALLQETADLVGDLVRTVRAATSLDQPLDRIPGMYCRYCPILSECSEGQTAARVASIGG